MNILVCGGRNYNDAFTVGAYLGGLAKQVAITRIITGGAPGADKLAELWARSRGIDVDIYKADWKRLGAAAGPIRNQLMLDKGAPSAVVAFPGGTGTADMVRRAKDAGVKVYEVPAGGIAQ